MRQAVFAEIAVLCEELLADADLARVFSAHLLPEVSKNKWYNGLNISQILMRCKNRTCEPTRPAGGEQIRLQTRRLRRPPPLSYQQRGHLSELYSNLYPKKSILSAERYIIKIK